MYKLTHITRTLSLLICTLVCLFSIEETQAQTYPVQPNVYASSPDSNYLKLQNHGGTTNTTDGITRIDVKTDITFPNNPVFSYNPDSGELTVYTTDGQTKVGSINLKNEGKEAFPLTITDKKGNIYQVDVVSDADGKPVKDENGNPKLSSTLTGTQGAPLPDNSFNPQEVDDTRAVVTFSKGDGKYAFDTWRKEYADISLICDLYKRVGENIYVPWKLLPEGSSDKVDVTIRVKDKTIDPSSVIFSTPQGVCFSARAKGDNTYELTVTSGKPGDVQDIYALYPVNGSGEKFETLGRLCVVTYKPQTLKLHVVEVKGNKIADRDALAESLRSIYEPVGVTWNIDYEEFSYDDTDNFFDRKSGLLSAYNAKMLNLQSAYKASKGSLDSDACYMFILGNSGVEKNRDTQGFMPRGKQFGYIFKDNISGNAMGQIMAHELGHGRWRLLHTFADTYGGKMKKGSTDNLMDYSGGTHLAKWQWDEINSPAWFTNPFAGDEQGMVAERYYIKINHDGVFFTPAGNPVMLKAGTKIYAVCIDYSRFPDWAVYNFEEDGKEYDTDWSDHGAGGITFKSYYQIGATANKYPLPSQVTGNATYIDFERVDSNNIRILLMQEATKRTFTNNGNNLVASRSMPYTGTLAEVDKSNLLNITKCSYFSSLVPANDEDIPTGNVSYKIHKDTATGKYTVSASLKGEPRNSTVAAQKAEIEKQLSRLSEEKLNELGGLDGSKSELVNQATDDDGEFYVKEMNGREWLQTIAGLGESVWENAALPEKYWNKDKEYDNSTIHVPPTLAGVSDGVVGQITDYPQLVKLGYDIATKEEVRTALWNSVKNISIGSVKSLAIQAIKDKIEKYNFQDKSYLGYHELGKDGVQVASLMMGAGFYKKGTEGLKAGVEDTGEKIKYEVKKKLDDIEDEMQNSDEFKALLNSAKERYKGKLSEQEWTEKYKTLYKNRAKGAISEEKFNDLMGSDALQFEVEVNGTKRYIDNLLNGCAREVKSGKVTWGAYKKQVMNDIGIVHGRLSKQVKRVEWHCFDEVAPSFVENVKKELTKNGLEYGKDFIIIKY